MAINLICYTTIDATILQNKLNQFEAKYAYLFPTEYILYSVDGLGRYGKEIANDFNFDPLNRFMVALNNKQSEFNTTNMANLLRKELGSENIIVLFEGETLI